PAPTVDLTPTHEAHATPIPVRRNLDAVFPEFDPRMEEIVVNLRQIKKSKRNARERPFPAVWFQQQERDHEADHDNGGYPEKQRPSRGVNPHRQQHAAAILAGIEHFTQSNAKKAGPRVARASLFCGDWTVVT